MRRFILFLIILLLSVWLGVKIAEDPGYAVFAYRHWTVEMPLWFAITCLIIFLFLLYGLLHFFDTLDFSFYRLKNWLRWRRKYRSYNKTNRGLIELIEGHWRPAEQYLISGVAQSDAPLINYIAAAKAAHEMGEYDRRDIYLRKAHQYSPQAKIAVGLTQAQLQFNEGKLEQALATLDHLRQIAPKHNFVLQLLEKVYLQLSDWKGLLKLLPTLRKTKIINDAQLSHLEEKSYQELLRQAANKPDPLKSMQEIWHTIPKKWSKDPALITGYVNLLLPFPEAENEIENLINQVLKKGWNRELVRIYGLLATFDPKHQLDRAEKWYKVYGNQAMLLLTLGRLSMRCQLWGKARSYFEESLKLEPNPEAYAEYGKLLEELGDIHAAARQYREGLVLMG